MKNVTIIGIGMGQDTLTQEGLRAIGQAEVLLGAPRLLAACPAGNKPAYAAYEPDWVAQIIRESASERFAVLVSGDTGFYSAAQGLLLALAEYEVSLSPGISSLAYFFARLKRPWQGAALLSCHGRTANLVDAVRRNKCTFALTGHNVSLLAAQLTQAGFGGLRATLGEDLGRESERILDLPVAALMAEPVGRLAVLLVENPAADARVRFGIPDEEFIRGDAPMTKAEVRAVILSRLGLMPGAVCCDIGAGTGSVAIEMALAAYEGYVYALDKNEEAIRLISENCRRFHIGNVTPVLGGAPAVLGDLPPLDAAFIGGSGGMMGDIFTMVLSMNPKARIVVSAIALESVSAAIEACQAHGLAAEIVQLNAARAKPAGNLHMLLAQNPVFIISAGGNYE
ncbi:MAG: precorrin-6y C5,15-methyltransferase (decarboxylating) subunit CbiE [Candidatus Pelethousia sp.]|nr:precorrin-6y C5,15-methyltransferase (decarboxylating) subunit CbiE [Candidatus Pelethousia sp.]